MKFDKIAERKLYISDETTGDGTEVCIEIGRPRWTEVDVEAICSVFIDGLMSKALDIYGADLLNALECALAFVDSELRNLGPTKKVQWPGGESYFD